MSKDESRVKAVRAVAQAVVNQQERFSADAVMVAKAMLTITHDADRRKMYRGEDSRV